MPPEQAAPVCLIVNPSAGGGKARRIAPQAEQALRGHGLQVRRVDTRDIAHARELAMAAAAGGEVVAVLSGDGAIGAIGDALRAVPGAVLGVLPGGRGNDLARSLGISQELSPACATIAGGVRRAMDVGEVSVLGSSDRGRAFVGIASVGFDSDANRIANEAPSWLGNLVYAYGALRALAAWRPARFELELDPPDGERKTFTAYTVGACNSKSYGGGMRAAPGAMLDDGLLDVIVLENVSKLTFLTKILPRVFKGEHVREPRVHVLHAKELVVSADRPFTMYADGDPIGELPLRVRVLAGAIDVLVPASSGTAPDSAFSGAPPPAAAPAPREPSERAGAGGHPEER
ncbi:MAG TPA: diacylglycerol kinase family protein [Solirubrobacteraceae bacterium]|nr:diacylglycerol kinase family protein [Solirubrobacteraceae bacterium]